MSVIVEHQRKAKDPRVGTPRKNARLSSIGLWLVKCAYEVGMVVEDDSYYTNSIRRSTRCQKERKRAGPAL